MKQILVILLAFCCLAANAQNQVIRRQGANKGTNATETKASTSSSQAKQASSSPKKQEASRTKASTSNTQTKQTSSTENKQISRQTSASYSNGVLTVNGVRYEFALVEAGTFTMGATAEQGSLADDNEKPAHQVTLTKDYYMGKTEVTQALWKAVMGSNPSRFKGDNLPVEKVSWNDCQEFIQKLNRLTGKTFRLPTEAEWEFAARGGRLSNGYRYSGSNNLDEVAWHGGEGGNSGSTRAIGTKKPNELGIYDMSGNVWEWCQDWYGHYSSNVQYDSTGPTSGSNRVSRGGSWNYDAWSCRSSMRDRYNPGDRRYDHGFRLCLSSKTNASYSNGVLTVNGMHYEFALVEAGTFTMGASAEQGSDAESSEWPTHKVILTKDYYMGKTEVTQALWTAVMGNNPSHSKGDNKPVEQVSWNDCQEFISKLNSLTGKTFRLPTEAEWEFAARGGKRSKGYKYSGSNNLNEVAWYGGGQTHAVGTRKPNELGIYDMSGNVYEWCQDWYGKYSSNAQYNPTGRTGGSRRVNRGGSWFNDASFCRSSLRGHDLPNVAGIGIGFRLCLSE